jgi:hypothetical protein
MNNNIITHSLLAVTLVVLLVLLTDPFMNFMPPMVALVALLIIVILVGIWTGSILRESPGDERAILHSMNAGRVAYLSGTGVLTLAVVYQGLVHHMVNTEVALALGIMVVAKIVAQQYFEKYR